jgi:hypothetical protein
MHTFLNLIPFCDNKGRVIFLPKDATIGDLARWGLFQWRVVPKGEPLADNWYRDAHP